MLDPNIYANKGSGDIIRSAEWNDIVAEINRKADTAGDTFTGPLIINSSVAIGKNSSPQATLDLQGQLQFSTTSTSGTRMRMFRGLLADVNIIGAHANNLVFTLARHMNSAATPPYSFVVGHTVLTPFGTGPFQLLRSHTDVQFQVTHNGDATVANRLFIQGPGGSPHDVSLTGGGMLVIGRTNATNIAIDTNEIMARNNSATSTLFLNANGGNVRVGGTVIGSSDVRQKREIRPIKDALTKLTALRGVNFKWKDIKRQQNQQLGFVAQEIEEQFPELVITDKKGYKAVNYFGMTAPIVEAIKEQQKQIEHIIAENRELKISLDKLSCDMEGKDYAEMFESASGEPIAAGTSVVLEADKIRPAEEGEIPIGVISKSPGLVRGVYTEWPDKYVRDEFGDYVMEEVKEEVMVPKTKKVKEERQRVELKEVEEKITRTEIVKKGKKYVQQEVVETVKREVPQAITKEVPLYGPDGKTKVGTTEVPVLEEVEIEVEERDKDGNVIMVGSGEFQKVLRRKLNPKYKADQPYQSRLERPEWHMVGLFGQLPLLKGQATGPNWVKMKKISTKVELWLVK